MYVYRCIAPIQQSRHAKCCIKANFASTWAKFEIQVVQNIHRLIHKKHLTCRYFKVVYGERFFLAPAIANKVQRSDRTREISLVNRQSGDVLERFSSAQDDVVVTGNRLAFVLPPRYENTEIAVYVNLEEGKV